MDANHSFTTNIFEYKDVDRLEESCKKHHVMVSKAGSQCFLLSSSNEAILSVIKECFNENEYVVEDGHVYVMKNQRTEV